MASRRNKVCKLIAQEGFMLQDSANSKSLLERRCRQVAKLKPIARSPASSFPHPDDCFSRDPPISKILDFLFLGNARDSRNEKLLADRGITHIINATREQPNVFEKNGAIKYMRVAVNDSNDDDLMPHFHAVNEFIDEARNQGGKVLVHCKAGISRSASLVIAYLVAHSALSVGEACTLANHLRSVIGPSLNFLSQLEKFQRSLPNTAVEHPLVRDMISQLWRDFQLSQVSSCSLALRDGRGPEIMAENPQVCCDV